MGAGAGRGWFRTLHGFRHDKTRTRMTRVWTLLIYVFSYHARREGRVLFLCRYWVRPRFSTRIQEAQMKRVTGIGGIFFNANDPVALRAWYKQHLGIDVQEWGGTAFTWTDAAGNPTKGSTVWSIGASNSEHFA